MHSRSLLRWILIAVPLIAPALSAQTQTVSTYDAGTAPTADTDQLVFQVTEADGDIYGDDSTEDATVAVSGVCVNGQPLSGESSNNPPAAGKYYVEYSVNEDGYREITITFGTAVSSPDTVSVKLERDSGTDTPIGELIDWRSTEPPAPLV